MGEVIQFPAMGGHPIARMLRHQYSLAKSQGERELLFFEAIKELERLSDHDRVKTAKLLRLERESDRIHAVSEAFHREFD